MSDLRAELERVLTENGVTQIPGGIHSWRCEYPVEGAPPCNCAEILLNDLVKVVEEGKE